MSIKTVNLYKSVATMISGGLLTISWLVYVTLFSDMSIWGVVIAHMLLILMSFWVLKNNERGLKKQVQRFSLILITIGNFAIAMTMSDLVVPISVDFMWIVTPIGWLTFSLGYGLFGITFLYEKPVMRWVGIAFLTGIIALIIGFAGKGWIIILSATALGMAGIGVGYILLGVAQYFGIGATLHSLPSLALLMIFMVACSAPEAAVIPTAVPPTEAAVIPTAVPPTEAAFLEAVKANDVAEVQRLLEAGVVPNFEQGATPQPMFMAVSRGNLEMVKLLVAYGGDLTVEVPSVGTSLVEFAVAEAQWPIAKFIIDADVEFDIDSPDDRDITLLMYAAQDGEVELVGWLIDQGADLDYQGIGGHAALHAAAFNNKPEVVQILIEAGAKLDPKNHEGLTPLAQAISVGNDESAQILREAEPEE